MSLSIAPELEFQLTVVANLVHFGAWVLQTPVNSIHLIPIFEADESR